MTFLRCLPNIVIMTPADENETRRMLYTGFLHEGPCTVRYPRGAGPGVPVESGMHAIPIGKAEERRRGSRIAFLSFGPLLHHVMAVADRLDATVFNMRFVKPLDEDIVLSLVRDHDLLVTVEENAAGGAGSAGERVSRGAWGWRADCCRSGFPTGSSSTAAVMTCSRMRDSIQPGSRAPSTSISPVTTTARTTNVRPARSGGSDASPPPASRRDRPPLQRSRRAVMGTRGSVVCFRTQVSAAATRRR